MRPYLARAFRLRSSHKGTSLLASGFGVAAASTLETLEAREGTAAVRLSQLLKGCAIKQTGLQARLDQQTDHPFRVLGAERRQRDHQNLTHLVQLFERVFAPQISST